MIDYEVIKKCDFPILKIKNFIAKDELVKIKDEIVRLSADMKREEFVIREYDRVYLDDYYENDRNKSNILKNIEYNLFTDEIKKIYSSINETSFKLIPTTTKHETQLTIYGDGGEYRWHVDATDLRIVNWILFIDINSDFIGGENEISNDAYDEDMLEAYHEKNSDIKTKHEDNVLIMMPCWVTHRVAPVFCKSKDILKGRISINGHIGYRS
jgi:Rps23 Pro-64 3,4-dihydroxylase Tpa1-like proline 4-hydroxylase